LLPYLGHIDRNRWYTNFGPLVQAFETRCGAMLGGASCVTAASGTVALELALRALALPAGSRVLMPSFTFPATAIAVQRAGCEPLLCDVDPQRWALLPEQARALAARHRVAAIVPVAVFGIGVDPVAWDTVAAETGLPVVVDAAAAFPSIRPSERVVAVYSLHATKPLGIGEGGLVASRDPAFAERVRRLSNYGFESGWIREAGTNAKLSEHAAAVGLAQLDRADEVLLRRERVWFAYREAFAAEGLGAGMDAVTASGAPANFVVRFAAGAAACAEALAREGIESRRWYCPPVHLHAAFAHLPRAGALDVTDDLVEHLIGLPFHADLAERDIRRVVRAVAAIAARC